MTLFELDPVPTVDGRAGSRNAARRARVVARPPWASWSGSRAGRYMQFMTTYLIVEGVQGRGPMQLAPFQVDVLEQLCAEDTDTLELSVARGAGKSTFFAGLGLTATFVEDDTPQVPLVAVDLRQLDKTAYGHAVAMVDRSPELADRCVVYTAPGNKQISPAWNGGSMFPMPSDVEALQGLNPSLGLVEEYGFTSPEAWDALSGGSGKRPWSVIAGLGTVGTRKSQAWKFEQLHREGRRLPGHVRIKYAGDDGCDIHDRAQWRKANPAIDAGFFLERKVESDVHQKPETWFRNFRLNQWVDDIGAQSWLGPTAHEMVHALADPDYVWDAQRPTWVGVDVSLRYDSTAVVAVQHDGTWWRARAWIWRAVPGRTVDQAPVRAVLLDMPTTAVRGVAYDPRFFEASAQELAERGVPMIEVPQTSQRMVPAIGTMYAWLTQGLVRHDGNPEFTAQIIHAVRREAETGFTLSKIRSEMKIDAAIALALAASIADPDPSRHVVSDDAYRIW